MKLDDIEIRKYTDVTPFAGGVRVEVGRLTEYINKNFISVEEVEGMKVKATESDNGYETGVTYGGKRLSHNMKIGYNQALDNIRQRIKERNNG